jgi:hypothetical protein
MAKSALCLEHARDRLRALRAEKPATAAGQVRWAWPEIKVALEVGHSLTTVHQRLAEVGIELPYRRLSYYVTKLRREDNERAARLPMSAESLRAAASTPATAKSDHHEQNSKSDPLANLRRLSEQRPGFQWDEAPPDKNKLF